MTRRSKGIPFSKANQTREILRRAAIERGLRNGSNQTPVCDIENVETKPYKPVELTFNWQGDPESPMMLPVKITPESHPHLAQTLDVANQMARGDEDSELNGSVDSALKTAGGENVKDALVAGVQNWHNYKERA